MIDIEADVYDMCARAVLAEFSDCLTSSQNVAAPASFPAVSIVEADNKTDQSMVDSSGREKGAIVAYDVKCFSNLRTGAKRQARKLLQAVDSQLCGVHFRRSFTSQGAMASNPSVYQITARYIAGSTDQGKIYRR